MKPTLHVHPRTGEHQAVLAQGYLKLSILMKKITKCQSFFKNVFTDVLKDSNANLLLYIAILRALKP